MSSLPAISCPTCDGRYVPRRTNQRYCNRACQRNATQGQRGGAHSPEAKRRNYAHYARSTWLCYDINRMPKEKLLGFLAEIIEAAREHDGQLRGILTDPKLLGACRGSTIGKLYPDTADPSVKNIAKVADTYCRTIWGMGFGM